MSYCRWSTDDFQCDVYVYADARGGWTTHVASNRYAYKEPLPPVVECDPDNEEVWQAWLARHEVMRRLIDEADRVTIGLPHDGETYNDDTPSQCADRLEMLKGLGYVVPQDAIDSLRQEAAEGVGA